jgi:hypothetical protein
MAGREPDLRLKKLSSLGSVDREAVFGDFMLYQQNPDDSYLF